MKKTKNIIFLIGLLIFLGLFTNKGYAAEGECGYFGGVSEGSFLPMVIEKYVGIKDKGAQIFKYKEVVFITDKPVVVEGRIQVNLEKINYETTPKGSVKEEYAINAKSKDGTVSVNRIVKLDTLYMFDEETEVVTKNSKLSSWSETITTPKGTYTVDNNESLYLYKSSVVENTPGVTYYNTVLSSEVTLVNTKDETDRITITITNDDDNGINGYDEYWSRLESQNLIINLESTNFSRGIKVKSKTEAYKTIYKAKTDPRSSLRETYNQKLKKNGTLEYSIESGFTNLKEDEKTKKFIVKISEKPAEKLFIPKELGITNGSNSEDDLKKLYSLKVFTMPVSRNTVYESTIISRGEFIKALVLAIDMDMSKYAKPKKSSTQVFGDIPYDNPLYPYVMAAYDSKLIRGRGENFEMDKPIQMQEVYVLCIRAIGLDNSSSVVPMTKYLDDTDISNWAKNEIVIGSQIGLFEGKNGYIYPKKWCSIPTAAAIINKLIDFLRTDISKTY